MCIRDRYGVPRVNKSNQTLEVDFAMGTDCNPKDWFEQPNVVKQWIDTWRTGTGASHGCSFWSIILSYTQTPPMKTQYKIKERKVDKTTLFVAQFKPWWFPFVWFSCYGVNVCCCYETAMQVCELHCSGKYLTEYQLSWLISTIDRSLDTWRTGTWASHKCSFWSIILSYTQKPDDLHTRTNFPNCPQGS